MFITNFTFLALGDTQGFLAVHLHCEVFKNSNYLQKVKYLIYLSNSISLRPLGFKLRPCNIFIEKKINYAYMELNLAYQTFNMAVIMNAFKFRITRVIPSALFGRTFNICHYFYAYHFFPACSGKLKCGF